MSAIADLEVKVKNGVKKVELKAQSGSFFVKGWIKDAEKKDADICLFLLRSSEETMKRKKEQYKICLTPSTTYHSASLSKSSFDRIPKATTTPTKSTFIDTIFLTDRSVYRCNFFKENASFANLKTSSIMARIGLYVSQFARLSSKLLTNRRKNPFSSSSPLSLNTVSG